MSDAAQEARGAVGGVLGRALAWAYGLGVARRNRRFDRGRGVIEFDRPVISVGNLSVGGTGKTPTTLWIVRTLREGGFWPAVAMRGYGAPSGRGEESDEAREYRAAASDLPLVARPDRVEGLLDLFATGEGKRVDSVVLDDGFQHRRIARELDLVLMDATRPATRDSLLPAGWLREPVASLARADAVLLTHAGRAGSRGVSALREELLRGFPGLRVFACDHAWWGLLRGPVGPGAERASEDAELPVEWLRGKRVLGVCALGNPEHFLARASEACGGTLAGRITLRDHDPYEPATIAGVLRAAEQVKADVVVTTQKDWMKLRRVKPGAWPCAVVRPVVTLRFAGEGGGDEQALRELVLHAAERGREAHAERALWEGEDVGGGPQGEHEGAEADGKEPAGPLP